MCLDKELRIKNLVSSSGGTWKPWQHQQGPLILNRSLESIQIWVRARTGLTLNTCPNRIIQRIQVRWWWWPHWLHPECLWSQSVPQKLLHGLSGVTGCAIPLKCVIPSPIVLVQGWNDLYVALAVQGATINPDWFEPEAISSDKAKAYCLDWKFALGHEAHRWVDIGLVDSKVAVIPLVHGHVDIPFLFIRKDNQLARIRFEPVKDRLGTLDSLLSLLCCEPLASLFGPCLHAQIGLDECAQFEEKEHLTSVCDVSAHPVVVHEVKAVVHKVKAVMHKVKAVVHKVKVAAYKVDM